MSADFRQRLTFDLASGELRDGDTRYVILREDSLMGLFKRLSEPARTDAFKAFAASITEHGARSAAHYRARDGDTGDLLATIAATAPQLGWGVWRFSRAEAGELHPAIEPCEDALSAALMNAGPVIHPPLILMNAAPLEHFERWDIHSEGTQPSVRAVTDALDAERIALREKLGYAPPHFPLADHYAGDRWMYGDAHQKLVDSGDWREHIDLRTHRYMLEDTVLGLAFLVSVARWADCDVPVAKGLLALAGAILGRDLRRGPRTLEALGLASLSRAEMKRLLEQGRE